MAAGQNSASTGTSIRAGTGSSETTQVCVDLGLELALEAEAAGAGVEEAIGQGEILEPLSARAAGDRRPLGCRGLDRSARAVPDLIEPKGRESGRCSISLFMQFFSQLLAGHLRKAERAGIEARHKAPAPSSARTPLDSARDAFATASAASAFERQGLGDGLGESPLARRKRLAHRPATGRRSRRQAPSSSSGCGGRSPRAPGARSPCRP